MIKKTKLILLRHADITNVMTKEMDQNKMRVEQDGNVGSRERDMVFDPGYDILHTCMYVYPSIRPNFSANIWLFLSPIFDSVSLPNISSHRLV